jgi:hypothetical protein
MRSLPTTFWIVATSLILLHPVQSRAGGDYEITAIPIGAAQVQRGEQDVSYRLPMGLHGPLPQALVLIAAQPRPVEEVLPPTSAPDSQKADAESAQSHSSSPRGASQEQVPATVRFQVAGRALPEWILYKEATAYVINLSTLRSNPEYRTGRLAMKVETISDAAHLDLVLLGMPDPLLLDETMDGPLGGFVEAAANPEAKAYFAALVKEIAGQKPSARGEYEKLRTTKDQRVARLARRGLRMLSYDLRRWPLSGNLLEHYRWGLYLQACGLFAPAFREFEECRIIDPRRSEAQFRAGEMLDRQAGTPFDVIYYMERAFEGAAPPTSDWYVLLVILKSRGDKTLKLEEIDTVKGSWLFAAKMIQAAGDGCLRLRTSAFEVENEQVQAFTAYEGGVWGPAENVIQVRGWFDGVIAVRPRLASEADEPAVATVGGDRGPKGACLSAIFSDASWQDYMKAWTQQLAWDCQVAELNPQPPLGPEAAGCGVQPIPYEGYGLRAALRYYMTPAMLRRAKIADLPVPDSHVQLWELEGPYPVNEQPPTDRLPDRHVLDPIPAGPPPQTIALVSQEDFINLGSLFPDAGWARARATCWVFSPIDQELRMWLGQNDGMAVWLNGRCVHSGRRYSGGNYEDKNLTDTIVSWANLKQGWNELRVVVESWPAPRNKGWGFSVRLSTWDNKPVPDLACVNARPAEGVVPPSPPPAGYYSWDQVKDDRYELLPRLSATDLAEITGVKGLSIVGSIQGDQGYAAITVPGRPSSAGYRSPAGDWQMGKDRDDVLNNVLDWARESCAAYRYAKDGKTRDLLFVRPEGAEAYLRLLKEPPAAETLFGKRRPTDRLLGYAVIPAGAAEAALLVVDALLTDGTAWPADEEDLLAPVSAEYIPNRPVEPPQGPQP